MKIGQTEYEIVLLLTPSFSEEQAKEFVEEWKKTSLQGCDVTFEDYWGKKTLAYPIKKQDSAHYMVICCNAPGERIAPLDEEIRLESKVLRHLITKYEKGASHTTQAEREEWNKENLPEKKTSSRPEEKRAPRRPHRSAAPAAASLSPAKDHSSDEKLNKEQLDKKLNDILDGDLDF